MRAHVVAILAVLGVCTGDNLAGAVEYEARIDVTNEEDLYELEVTDQITPDTLTALLELMHDGVDLDAADCQRLYALPGLTWADVEGIVAYRHEHGHVTAQHLLVAGLIDEEQLVEIRPFLVSHAAGEGRTLAAGSAPRRPGRPTTIARRPRRSRCGFARLTA